MARTGILGGTFNPPHIGHLAIAEHALEGLALDSVLLIPAAQPPHKEVEEDPGAEHRLEMCRLATAGDDRLEVSRLELDRGGRSYTVETLAALQRQFPDDELAFIVGGDMAMNLPEWREPERLLELARLAIAERGEHGRGRIRERLADLADGDRWLFFDMPPVEVSSSEVRRLVADGGPFRDLVPDGVARYIEDHGLYGARAR